MSWRKRMSRGLITVIMLDEHFVRLYTNRLAIWRKDGAQLTWDELQYVKTEVWGDRVAVEVYPVDREVVNLRNTRHLWSSASIEAAVRETCVHPEFQGDGE